MLAEVSAAYEGGFDVGEEGADIARRLCPRYYAHTTPHRLMFLGHGRWRPSTGPVRNECGAATGRDLERARILP